MANLKTPWMTNRWLTAAQERLGGDARRWVAEVERNPNVNSALEKRYPFNLSWDEEAQVVKYQPAGIDQPWLRLDTGE